MTSTITAPDIAIPGSVEEVTAGWLTSALAVRYPGVRVRSVDVLNALVGACLKLRLRVVYDDRSERHGLPDHFVVKGNFQRRGPELAFMFHDEMRAYRDVVSKVNVNTPICYFAGERNSETMLILEDLTSDACRFGAIERSMTFDEAKSVLGQLANLHAHFWDSPDLADNGSLGWISRSLDSAHLSYIRSLLEPKRWAHYCSLPRGMVVPRNLVADAARLDRALLKQQEFHRRGVQTLCHGDAHSANMYFARRGCGLFDWALRRGPWHYDVTYFLVIALDVADRRRWESALLQHYLDQLALRGLTPPSLDEAIYCHRRELAFGCVLFVANGDQDENWRETATCAAAFRFGMAAEDHRMFDAIECEAGLT